MSSLIDFKLAEKLIRSFDEKNIDKEFSRNINKLQGLSGAGTAQCIANVAKLLRVNQYLEIGIYQASNLVQIATKNKDVVCCGVDNFSENFEENKNYSNPTTEEVVSKRLFDLKLKNCVIIKDDFRNFLKTTNIKNVELYFFDGPHRLQDQIDGIEMALPILADRAIIFIDDHASENVQESTRILLEKYKELELIRVLVGSSNVRTIFNQGQVVLKYNRVNK